MCSIKVTTDLLRSPEVWAEIKGQLTSNTRRRSMRQVCRGTVVADRSEVRRRPIEDNPQLIDHCSLIAN